MEYDPKTREYLRDEQLPSSEEYTSISKRQLPSTAAGLPGLLVREMPFLEDSNVSGFVLSNPRNIPENRKLQQNVFVRPSASDATIAHEIEHLLARQNLGEGSSINQKFDELIGDKDGKVKRSMFVSNAIKSLPYLEEKYGLVKNAYFNPVAMRAMTGNDFGVGFYEILASLAGLEASKNVDLTKDPVLRETLFADKDVRETYNALTGLRQTRLDPRDIAPYTRVKEKEKEESTMQKIKSKLGFSWGGHIPQAGNNKLI